MQVPVIVDYDPCRFLGGRYGPLGSEPASHRSLSNVAHTPRIKVRHGGFLAPRPCDSPSGYPQISHIHDRSPVIIPRDRINEWLDPDLADKNDVQNLLDTLPDPVLTPRIVSTRVNSVRNNGPELIEPVQ